MCFAPSFHPTWFLPTTEDDNTRRLDSRKHLACPAWFCYIPVQMLFRPYAGVSTAVLLFTKGAATERIWFYDMEYDGLSLDDKRQRVPENDIPDLLACWQHRHDPKFQKKRDARLAELQKQIAPLKKDRLEHHAIIHRLKFEEVIAGSSSLAPSDEVRVGVRGKG